MFHIPPRRKRMLGIRKLGHLLSTLHSQKRASCNKSVDNKPVDNKPISRCVRIACNSLLTTACCKLSILPTCCNLLKQLVTSLWINRLVATCGIFGCVITKPPSEKHEEKISFMSPCSAQVKFTS